MADEKRVLRQSARPMGYIFPKRIRDVIQGDTPVQKIGYEKSENAVVRELGSTWTDESGNQWKQHDGWVEKISKLEDIRNEINSIIKAPDVCPKCNREMTGRFDEKFWRLRGKCFSCIVDEETHIRATGDFIKYENGIMLDNALSYFKDIKNQMENYVKTLPNNITYVEEDGTRENWEYSNDKILEFFKNELKDLDDIISKIEEEKRNTL